MFLYIIHGLILELQVMFPRSPLIGGISAEDNTNDITSKIKTSHDFSQSK